jgi:hypothetical protein
MPAQTKPNNSQEPTSVIKSHACGQRRIAAPRPAAPPAATRPAPAVPPAAARLALSCAQLAPPRALLVCHVVLPPGLRLAARPANSRFGRSARPPWPLSPCRASPWPLCVEHSRVQPWPLRVEPLAALRAQRCCGRALGRRSEDLTRRRFRVRAWDVCSVRWRDKK